MSIHHDNLNELKRAYAQLETIANAIPVDGSPVSQIQFANLNFELMRVTRCLINEIGKKIDIDPWE